jgi:hypothetical protein
MLLAGTDKARVNITNFIVWARSLGLQDPDVFEVEDLTEVSVHLFLFLAAAMMMPIQLSLSLLSVFVCLWHSYHVLVTSVAGRATCPLGVDGRCPAHASHPCTPLGVAGAHALPQATIVSRRCMLATGCRCLCSDWCLYACALGCLYWYLRAFLLLWLWSRHLSCMHAGL